MPKATRDRDDLHIEIYVSREPGDLSVSSYSDFNTRTLEQAIAEAETFIAKCRAMQADIEANGLGEREPRLSTDPHIGETASRAWDKIMDRPGEGPAPGDNMLSSKALFRSFFK